MNDPKIITNLPYEVEVIEHTLVPMPDGTNLAAKIWMPKGAKDSPVPAILEYIPYRKRDWTAERDAVTHPYLAGHGYICARVDLRGSGDSEGVLRGEYLQQELNDGYECVEWLARQKWCDGKVAMTGISWGGFNGLQIAAMRPPALKTIITLCSTDDRYADDIHYIGGCMLTENLSWASTMHMYCACPPDPDLAGEKWKEMWLERLRHSGFWLEDWLEHQTRDEYWKHGSVCEDFSKIEIPVMAVSGWADGYTNAVFRLLKHLNVPRLGIVGPWSHKYPHLGVPGPAIGFLQETLRWCDHWLKKKQTGIMQEPQLRAWMQHSMPPSTGYEYRQGHWVGEASWPSQNIQCKTLIMTDKGSLVPEEDNREEKTPEKEMIINSPLTLGQFGGKWCAEAAPPDLADDQREEDGGALVFETAALKEDVEILGSVELDLTLESNEPIAMIVGRVSDVLPDGKVTRVSYGLLNLTHRDSHEFPEPLEPGKRYSISLCLNDIAQVFPKGHKIRVALSTSYWPVAWPAPKQVTLKVVAGLSKALLPVRAPQESDKEISDFPAPELSEPEPVEFLGKPENTWQVIRNLGTDESRLKVIKDRGALRFKKYDWTVRSRSEEYYDLRHDDLKSIKGENCWERSFARGDMDLRVLSKTKLTSDEENFYLYAQLDAYHNNERIFSDNNKKTIRRNFV